MGVYERWIVPRLLDLAMQNRLLDYYRHQTIETARGLVLEVGVGSGLNLPLYGPAVTRVVAIDPSPELLRLASSERQMWSFRYLCSEPFAETPAAC
jgi:SAM-dependent methyltransferase